MIQVIDFEMVAKFSAIFYKLDILKMDTVNLRSDIIRYYSRRISTSMDWRL